MSDHENYLRTALSSARDNSRTGERRNFDWTSSSSDGGQSDFSLRDRGRVRNSRVHGRSESEPRDHHWRQRLIADREIRYAPSLQGSNNTSNLYFHGRRQLYNTRSMDRFRLDTSDNESDHEREHPTRRRWISPRSRRTMRWVGARNVRRSSDSDDRSNWELNRQSNRSPNRGLNREVRAAGSSLRITRSRSRERDWHRDDRWRLFDYDILPRRTQSPIDSDSDDALSLQVGLDYQEGEPLRGRPLFKRR
jgi:hypothetical protein